MSPYLCSSQTKQKLTKKINIMKKCFAIFALFDNIGDLVPPVAVFWYR